MRVCVCVSAHAHDCFSITPRQKKRERKCYLCELRLSVRLGTLITVTPGNLEIAIESSYHQQLFELKQRQTILNMTADLNTSTYRGFLTRTVYLYNDIELRYTIQVGNPRYFDIGKNNYNRTERRKSRFSTISSLHCEPSPTHTLKWSRRNHVQIMCNTPSAYHVQHVSRATLYERTAQLLSLTESKLHLFELYFIG